MIKRVVFIGGGIIVVVVIAVVYILYSSLDSIVAAEIEKYGSQYTGTPVRVEGVNLDLVSGQGKISGFSVANPAGFATPHAIKANSIAVAVDVGTVTDNPVVIRDIVIEKPKVTYEIGDDGNNIDAIAKHVEAEVGSDDGAAAGSSGGDDDGGPKLIVENLYVKGGELGISATVLEGRTMTMHLENIHLRDIGSGDGGASAEQVAGIIAASLFRWLGVAIKGVDVDDIMKVIGDNVGGTPMKVKEAGELIGKEAEGAGKVIEKEAGEAEDQLKKLFK